MMKTQEVPAKTILNPTSGFLQEGYTHTINLYRGCALGNSLCGTFCYAQHNYFVTKGRAWGSFLDVKMGFVEAYRHDYDGLKKPRVGAPQPLRIYMSSVTDPYPPQEKVLQHTRSLLAAMIERPPDLLVIQSHTPLVANDLDLLRELRTRCQLQVNITVETDYDSLPGFPRHMYPPQLRLAALGQVRLAGITAVGVVSPLLPLQDVREFATALEQVCDRVILDHYVIGDGSKNGLRTRKSGFPEMLTRAGFEHWNKLEVLAEVTAIFKEIFTDDSRITISRSGFNQTG